MISPNKYEFPRSNTLEDMISDLEDGVLCHILSFLETRQAVATSILSKRWEFLWTYVDTLKIECYSWPSYVKDLPLRDYREIQFQQSVTRILRLHRGDMKNMRLVCCGIERNKYDYVNWIHTALSKNVATLDLCFGHILDKWPLSFFHSQTLVVLKLLYADITNMNIPRAPFFPKLKKVRLYQPYCKNDSLNRFISGCPTLEYFELDCDHGHGSKDYSGEPFYVSSATLKTFHFYCHLSTVYDPKIVLNTPALEDLMIWKSQNSKVMVESSMPSLRKAKISIPLPELDNYSSSHSSLRVLEFLSNVSILCVNVDSYTRAMIKSNLSANFNNLTRLEIIDWQFGLDLLRLFMEKSNNLKVVALSKRTVDKASGVVWEEPQHVPKCLLSSLKIVSIYGYQNEEEEEVELMIKYILGNAQVLKSMKIDRPFYVRTDNEFRLHMLQKMSMFPRASSICEISFN